MSVREEKEYGFLGLGICRRASKNNDKSSCSWDKKRIEQ